MLYYERGDITRTHLTHIIHGCNNQGAFNAGVAKAIACTFPQAQKEYFDLVNNKNFTQREYLLGMVQIIQTKNKVIGNCFTQPSYGRSGIHASLKYIGDSIQSFIDILKPEAIASPKIGCGLGGLSWDVVKEVYNELCESNPGTSFIIYDIGQ